MTPAHRKLLSLLLLVGFMAFTLRSPTLAAGASASDAVLASAILPGEQPGGGDAAFSQVAWTLVHAKIPVPDHAWVKTHATPPTADRTDAQIVTAPDEETWFAVQAVMHKENGVPVEIELLRPIEWLIGNEVEPERSVWLELPEMHIAGWADIVGIEESPPLSPLSGPVVTGTFKHDADAVVVLKFDSQADEVTCTPDHPFWSERRHEFVAASDLLPGEPVATSTGQPALLTSITPRAGPTTVYGLEVYGEHVYHVSSSGLLVHNVSQWRTKYLGKTPDRNSTVGKQVQARMRANGTLIDTPHGPMVKASDNTWVNFNTTDMAHIYGASRWWNRVGRYISKLDRDKSNPNSITRQFMKSSDNYVLDSKSANRREGGR